MKFHWMLPKGGEVALDGRQAAREAARYRIESMQSTSPAVRPDIVGWTHFARHAEAAGIDSVLISFSRYEPDPFVVACALGQAVSKLKFIIAYRSGLMQPTTFVQQMNTVSALVQGRVSFNIVKGECLALVGESGSGKSATALSILKLLPYPAAHHPSGHRWRRRRVGRHLGQAGGPPRAAGRSPDGGRLRGARSGASRSARRTGARGARA